VDASLLLTLSVLPCEQCLAEVESCEIFVVFGFVDRPPSTYLFHGVPWLSVLSDFRLFLFGCSVCQLESRANLACS
jgi:hypothetical protein